MAIKAMKANTNVTSDIEEQVAQAKAEKSKKGKLGQDFSLGGVSQMDISLVMRHLGIMLKSGMSLAETLIVMSEQAPTPKLQQTFFEIYEVVQDGTSMATAMKDHPKVFDKVTISIVDVGEQGGTLERNLNFLSDYLKQNHELNSKVKGALMYPLIVFILTAAEMLGVMIFIMPTLDTLFQSFENVPATTRFVMDLSVGIRANWLPVLIVSVVLIIGNVLFFRTEKGGVVKDKLNMKIPVLKKLKMYHILTNFSRTLGILLESGIPIVTALRIAKETTGNAEYEEVLNHVYEEVEAGASLSEALGKHEKYFPGTYVKMIQVGEETGSLEENLMYLFDFYASQVGDMSDNLATLLEPILLIFIGLMIGALAIMIILPIYQLTGSVSDIG